ncbi:hypothetical protein N752_08940 [Desulforamulus aquiferis]|nr:sigma-E processing peptidase SpoIIGA [Desulforamulus aquiferis]RYD05460.1 hypothetical protein N752_08940 [Desulforamulus aquiferis]
MRQVVYVDELIFVNLVMNFTVLWLTSRFTGNRLIPARMFTAATVGCIYALSLFIPGLGLFGVLYIKLLLGLVMVFIAFKYSGWRKLLKDTLLLMLASFFTAGLAMGLQYLLVSNTGGYSSNWLGQAEYNKWLVLALTIIFSYLMGKWGAMIWLKRVQQSICEMPVAVYLWGKKALVRGLVDTGNQLIEPLSQHPVIVVEYEVLRSVLPVKISEAISDPKLSDGSLAIMSLSDTPYAERLRVIPFQSLGRENGLLLGIRPDVVEIWHGTEKLEIRDVVVGIYGKKLSLDQITGP